ncbi:MAG: S49 family peptidase [Proteobacteria bacterium]|nr:MAG: S49 family peptidase [Pseudomonadota bacterium]
MGVRVANFGDILQEIQDEQLKAAQAFDTVRRRHLKALADHTGRNVIAYYSGWQAKGSVGGTEIRDEDRDGFMRCVHGLNCDLGLDFILHTPGGSIAATQSIIVYLREKFGRNIRAIVPHTAMSGGTIMACSAASIVMARHSSIGPIDPQIRGIPAKGVLDEFRKAFEEISAEPKKEAVWRPILSQYSPTFIGQCRNAIAWSEAFAREQLEECMFRGSPNKTKKIDKVIDALTEYDAVKLHERQIGYKEARDIGLKIDLLESDKDLQDLVLTAHHCFVHTLSNTNAIKIIENQTGGAFIKNGAPR